jgi:basic membrane protein A
VGTPSTSSSPVGGGSTKLIRVAVVLSSATTDMAFSQSMYSSLVSVQKEMGGEAFMEIRKSENMFKVPEAAAALRDYATQGFDIVIAHGSQYGSSVEEIAKDFPNTTFAWGMEVNTLGQPNIYAYTAAAQEGGFVNGVLAAKLTKSKQIGVTGPVEIGDAKTYIEGFVQGVASVDPSIVVNKTWTGSFSDVALMTEAAKALIANGADILTGSSQAVVGSIGAAKDKGSVLWFGTQSDQSALTPTLAVASQVYDWTDMIKQIIANRAAGKLGGITFILQLKNDGLKIVYNSGYSLPADVKAAGDKALEDIKSGTIIVNP